jgi:GH24 family phage-related lysozyme (muramidase)
LRLTKRGLNLIKSLATLRLKPEPAGEGQVVLGYDHFVAADDPLALRTEIDAALADALLREDLMHAQRVVKKLVLVPVTPSMFDALTSFVVSTPPGALKESRLLVDLNRTAYLNVPEQMTRWKWNAKEPDRALLIRRLTEGLLFLQDGLPMNAVRAI